MPNFWYFTLVVGFFKLITTENTLEIEVKKHLNLLEDQIYFPVSIYLSGLATNLESLITNFSNYQLDANDDVTTYTLDLKDDVESIYEIFEDIGIETDCDEDVEDKIKQTIKKNEEELKIIVLEGISKAQRIISQARNVLMELQNRTVAVKMVAEKCLSVHDAECLLEVLSTIILMKHTLPKMVPIIGDQHETQLALLEDEIVAGIEKSMVKLFDGYVEILDDFLVCILKET